MKFNVKLNEGKRKDHLIILLPAIAFLCVVICTLAMTTDLFAPKKEYASLVLYEGPKPIPASTTATMKSISFFCTHHVL